jgi:hypothetical protein
MVFVVSISTLNSKVKLKDRFDFCRPPIGAGDASLVFDKQTSHLVATDARDVVTRVMQGTATVKE